MPIWGDRLLAAGGAPVTVPRDPARDAARDELLKADYHKNDPTVLERVVDWIWDHIDRAMGSISGDGTDGTTGLVLFLVVAVVIGAALWWRLGAPKRAARTVLGVYGTEGPRSADRYRAEAAGHAAAGRWSEAVREQMRALVRALEERTLLDARPGRTADEAAAEAGRALPEHAAALAAAARTFDDVAYGERTADQAAYQLLLDLDRTLERTRPVLAHASAAAAAPAPTTGGAA
ncbi:DUF4129 domain-containing protein [Streptomyces viridifaciens]|uniref:DUF4129 domain-containing protein n=1 Tax=Kitasatospora aureofaciens TaxID=1894 RepID=UPI000524DB35|nr:DUF4129 domain-containing protein [Kitasatospora aureofaciens]QEV01375.1 DUF4129 domain-containing protein [Streptomyces viridifaciens]UKZ07761.1 DUF4129 domain-containing protein [Streptomyces viridifaciens]HJD82484.1 DUF4129 domain-containing protein [Kitasatospora aureofaciens]